MMSMLVSNMLSKRPKRAVPNQFVIVETGRGTNGNFIRKEYFQSYNKIIAVRTVWPDETRIQLDRAYWHYSHTTNKYRNQFLGETTREIKRKIKSREYKLADLN